MRQITFLLVVVALLPGCTSTRDDTRFFDEVGALSKEEILAKGDSLAAAKKREAARRYYTFLADAFPNDPVGRQAALKVADTFFADNTLEGLTEARLRFRDFANRYPNDPNRPYALLMLARCSLAQARGPMRDLTPVREAVDSLKQVVEQFASSPHAGEAQELLRQSRETLAEHEYLVARYYFNLKAFDGARMRIDYLRANFPDSAAAAKGHALLEAIDAAAGGVATPAATPPGGPASGARPRR